MTKEKPKEEKPQKIELSGGLSIFGHPLSPIGITLDVSRDLSKAIQTFSNNLKRENIETKLISCKGADNQLNEVTAMVIVRGTYPQVRCPRLQEELKYLEGFGGEFSEREHYKEFCYCGEDMQKIPIVKEEEFAKNKIFECPYTKSKGR